MKKALIASTLLTALFANQVSAEDAKKTENAAEREKCYGVAKAGKNDCAAKDGAHSCAGQSKKDNDNMTWIYVPKGLCDKLANGSKDTGVKG